MAVSEHDKWFSPGMAAERAGVSRGTIMNAIKSQSLKASRNNRNAWKIAVDDLSAWMDGRAIVVAVDTDMSVAEPVNDEASVMTGLKVENAELKGRLDAQERLISQLQADLEHARRPIWRRLFG